MLHRTSVFSVLLIVITIFSASCTHSLKVRNADAFYTSNSGGILSVPVVLGVVTESSDTNINTQRLLDEVIDALRDSGDYVDVKRTFRYTDFSGDRRSDVDYVATLELNPNYQGSLWNWIPISWPGFLLWTPAWNGFVYKADLATTLKIQDPLNREVLVERKIPMRLNLRHAGINRTWIEIGWLEWSIIPFVGGIFWTRYDSQVTPILVSEVGELYGDYIAVEISKEIERAIQTE